MDLQLLHKANYKELEWRHMRWNKLLHIISIKFELATSCAILSQCTGCMEPVVKLLNVVQEVWPSGKVFT